jgi:DNA polymerase III delta prime subunit
MQRRTILSRIGHIPRVLFGSWRATGSLVVAFTTVRTLFCRHEWKHPVCEHWRMCDRCGCVEHLANTPDQPDARIHNADTPTT